MQTTPKQLPLIDGQSRMSDGMMGHPQYESEASRLQKEADNFTKKFEHQKK
jgi:hypothetical protein